MENNSNTNDTWQAHRDYYADVLKGANAKAHFTPTELEQIKNMFKDDIHLNQLGLPFWDMKAAILRSRFKIDAALKERGDIWSPSAGVCLVKESVRQQIEL